MGILQRFSDIMKSNINALLDKCEDPAKMIDQTLRNLREDLAEIKKETAGVMADEKNAKRKLDECNADIAKYTAAAQNAIKAGNDEDAKTLIAKKQAFEEKKVSLEQTYQLAQSNSTKMRQMHDKIANDIETLENKKDAIKAKIAVAKAQTHVNEVVAGGTKSASSLEAFNRMEAKADKMLDAAMAEAELNSGMTATDDLADKYAGGANNTSVDDELAAMKAAMGMEPAATATASADGIDVTVNVTTNGNN